MNTPPSLTESWRRHLAELPSVDPPETLWARLQPLAVPAPRRSRPLWPFAAAAAAALAALLAWPRADVVAPPGVATVPGGVDQNVRLLDEELTLAYARQADEAELAALWQARERVLAAGTETAPPMLARL